MDQQSPAEISTVNNAAKLSTDIAVMSERMTNVIQMLTDMKRNLENVISRVEYEQFKKTNDAFHNGTSDKLKTIEETQQKLHASIELQFEESAKDRNNLKEEIVAQKASWKVWSIVGGATWAIISAILIAFLIKFWV